MYRLISKEWRYDDRGEPIKRHLYMAKAPTALPREAPVGSRAVFDDGSIKIKTEKGWEDKEVGK